MERKLNIWRTTLQNTLCNLHRMLIHDSTQLLWCRTSYIHDYQFLVEKTIDEPMHHDKYERTNICLQKLQREKTPY